MPDVQTTNPLVPHPDPGIFAPKSNDQKRQVKPQGIGYDDYLKDICKRIDKECDERAEIRARRYTRNHNYWFGGERRWMYWTKDGWKSPETKKVKRLFSNNQFFYQLRTLLSTVVRSHSKLSVTPAAAATENEQKISAAKVATRTLHHDQKEKLSIDFMVREWTDKLLTGIAIRGQWYAKEGSTAKARMPVVENHQIQMPGSYICTTCGATGPEGAEHEHEVNNFPGEVLSVPIHTGYEEILCSLATQGSQKPTEASLCKLEY